MLQKLLITRLMCALILIGALSACASPATPAAIPTLTLVPATETPTRIPLTPSVVPTATIVVLTPTPTIGVLLSQALLQTTITPEASIVNALQQDISLGLGIAFERIQLVEVVPFVWFEDNLRCGIDTQVPSDDEAEEFGEIMRGLRYLFIVGSELFEYRVDGNSFEQCPEQYRPTGEVLLLVDPAAADLLFLVQRELARELDLSTRRIQLIDIAPYTWSDSSFGCPIPDQTYTEATIPGYRILVSAGDVDYLYHTDANTIYPCDIENEVLPEN